MGRPASAGDLRLMGVSPKPTHIVVIPSWYSSGRGSGGGYFRDQALALQAAGYRVAILAPDIHTRRDLRAGCAVSSTIAVEHDGVAVYRASRRVVVPRLPYRNALAWSRCGLSLFRAYVERHGMPDLVHAHSCLNAGVLAARIRRRHGVPFVLSEHSAGFAPGRLRRWERHLVGRVIRRTDALIAVSPHLAGLLQREFPWSSWTYVPNILGDAFLAPPADAPPRPGDGGFVFFCAARLSAEKNHALLLGAFADAFAGHSGTRLQLAGDGPMKPRLRQLCTELGVTRQVEFLGTREAEPLRDRMRAADAFVLASDSETFGVVIIEAQAAGLPVVSTASGGPDHLIAASNGLLVPVRDRPALRDALLRMRRESANYDRAQIRAEAIRHFGPAAFVRRFAEIAGQPSPHRREMASSLRSPR
jgi:glycosyltransferase involved in cell wall biosynthesis